MLWMRTVPKRMLESVSPEVHARTILPSFVSQMLNVRMEESVVRVELVQKMIPCLVRSMLIVRTEKDRVCLAENAPRDRKMNVRGVGVRECHLLMFSRECQVYHSFIS